MKDDVEIILEKLFEYYKVSSAAELSSKIDVHQKTISNWKTRNALSAVKKKCRELGIYNEIFGDIANVKITQGANSRAGGRDFIEHSSKENLQDVNKYEDLTISLLDKVIAKKGSEEELQYILMDLLRNE